MRKRTAVLSRFLFGVVVTIGVFWLLNSVSETTRFVTVMREGCAGRKTTVTREVRLVETTQILHNSQPVHPSHAQHLYSGFVPPSDIPCVDTSDQVDAALLNRRSIVERAFETRAGIAGFHNKSGILPPKQWRPEYKKLRNEEMSVWFSYSHKKRSGCNKEQPPLQYPGCVVNINHHYKYIWIKGKRVGSTAIREPLGWICDDSWLVPDDANMTYCSEQWQENTEVSVGEAEKYWNEYFVFTFIRNPYTRFASGYRFVSQLMGDCPKLVNFGKLCQSPFLFAKTCSMLSCCWSGAVTHHLHHVMEQNSCLLTEDSLPAVDFVGEMESLSKDLQSVLDEINRRKPSELPDLRLKDRVVKEINTQGKEYIRRLFLSNTTCLRQVERHYWSDFHRLGYERVTSNL